ncbi:MAG: CDP-glycerol glycerophosphotransferase family protein [Candidatus Acidiferrales bacterium]|jgi:hypothetical protein
MSKPRLLIPMSIQFSVRYILRTGLLDRLREVADPVILLGWSEKDLQKELEDARIEVHPLAEFKFSADHERVRSWLNLLHKKRLKTPSEPIWERRADVGRNLYHRLRRRARNQAVLAISALTGEQNLRRKEQTLFETETNGLEIQEQIDRLKPDAAFSLTPSLPNEEAALRACARHGVPLCASILSFDNITTRGWCAVLFDQYLVWNRYNAGELLRAYPEISPRQISIVGAPQFDFYWDRSYLWTEQEWRSQLALPEGRPVILFGGGYFACAPHEPRFLQQIDDAIEAKEIPGNPVILFRNHPVDPIERWQSVLQNVKHVVYDDPWPKGRITGHANVRTRDIQKLASCLYYSSVHVNVASTMALDGAIFDRPQIGPAYDDRPGTQYNQTARDLYQQEHYLPITRTGGVDIVYSRAELIRAVRSALENPGRLAEERRKIVKELCTYDDGRATERVGRSLRTFVEKTVLARDPIAQSA